MDASVINAIVAALSGIIGAGSGAAVSGFFARSSTKMQLEHAKLSVTAASALTVLNQLADRAAPFFLAVEEMSRLILQGDYGPDDVRKVAQKINIERATFQPHLPQELSRIAGELGQSFDRLASARGAEQIGKEVEVLKNKRLLFFEAYYNYRKNLLLLAQPK